jgi:cell division control protein 7
MANATVAVHEDAAENPSHSRQTSKMSFSRQTASVPPEDLFDQDSDCSESDQEVDDSVLEDMRKLEESFTGISQRYRLLNRIGEGTTLPVYLSKRS